MTLTPREAAVEYANCLRDGDFPRLVTLHDERLVCSLLGTSRVSGRYRGRELFFGHTFKHVLGVLAETNEIYLKGFRVGCADDHYAALLLHGGLPTRSGGRYNQHYLQIFRLVDGKFREIHELLDTAMMETQLFGKTFSTSLPAPAEALRPASLFTAMAPITSVAAGVKVREAFGSAFIASDWRACVELLHPEAVLQLVGSTPVSGVVRGRSAIVRHLAAHFMGRLQPGTLTVEPYSWMVCADDRGFCRMANLRGRFTDGREYRQTVGFVASYAGEAIGEVHLYFDTALEEQQMFGNDLRGGTDETAEEPFSILPDYRGP